jgi:hypothetical protein
LIFLEYLLKFSDALSLILEEPNGCSCPDQPIEKAIAIVRKIDAIKQSLLDLQNDLMALKSYMKGHLALGVKRSEPGLEVDVCDSGGCKIGCLGKTIDVEPNLDKMKWEVSSSDEHFADQLSSNDDMAIVSDIGPVVNAIVNQYNQYSQLVGEAITSKGHIIVEGRMATLVQLAEWRNKHMKVDFIPSRRGKSIC